MTDREKAIVMAYTGICMLEGDKFQIFHQYVEDILGRPVQTIEMGMEPVADEIKEKSGEDFMAICRDEQDQCGDCISRSGTYQKMLDLQSRKRERYLDIDDVHNVIYKMPPVSPMPKMGRWVMSDDGLYGPICNKCGAHPWKGYIPSVEEAANVFKFCSNCGAKMQEG